MISSDDRSRQVPAIPSVDGARLAVVLRTGQWALDDVANDLPAGRCSPQRLTDLAIALEQTAQVLRAAVRETTQQIPK